MINLISQMKLKSRYKYFSYIYNVLYVCNTAVVMSSTLSRRSYLIQYLNFETLPLKEPVLGFDSPLVPKS